MPLTMNATTVWIVDDDEDDQLFIQEAFDSGQTPVRMVILNDGLELLAELERCEQLPSLILLDINMPRKNGFEALSELKLVPAYASVPVVILTTSSSEDDQALAMRLGADQFFTKPLSFERLRLLAQELSSQWNLV